MYLPVLPDEFEAGNFFLKIVERTYLYFNIL